MLPVLQIGPFAIQAPSLLLLLGLWLGLTVGARFTKQFNVPSKKLDDVSLLSILIALIATFIQWVRDDKKETRRIDRAEDRAAAMGEDDDLAKYNKYLAGLNRLDETKES